MVHNAAAFVHGIYGCVADPLCFCINCDQCRIQQFIVEGSLRFQGLYCVVPDLCCFVACTCRRTPAAEPVQKIGE